MDLSERYQQMLDRQFRHPPLTRRSNQIRLVTVEPDSGKGTLELHMEIGSLNTKYVCLSYEWGVGPATETVLIDGKSLEIRNNLYEFLLAARTREYFPRIWIDAICISQYNFRERNHQVSIMGNIYSNAESVVVWLGLAATHLETLRDLKPSILDHGTPSSTTAKRSTRPRLRRQFQSRREDGDGEVEADVDGAVDALISSTYWTRAWIMQELILAAKTELFGVGSLPDILGMVHTWSRKRYKSALAAGSSGENPYTVNAPWAQFRRLIKRPDELRKTAPEKGQLSFREALLLSGVRGCHNPKDRIFAVVSLIHSGEQFKVDYGASKAELLADVIHFAFNQQTRGYDSDSTALLVRSAIDMIEPACTALELNPPSTFGFANVPDLMDTIAAFGKLEKRAYWTGKKATAAICIPMLVQNGQFVVQQTLQRQSVRLDDERWSFDSAIVVWRYDMHEWTSKSVKSRPTPPRNQMGLFE